MNQAFTAPVVREGGRRGREEGEGGEGGREGGRRGREWGREEREGGRGREGGEGGREWGREEREGGEGNVEKGMFVLCSSQNIRCCFCVPLTEINESFLCLVFKDGHKSEY